MSGPNTEMVIYTIMILYVLAFRGTRLIKETRRNL